MKRPNRILSALGVGTLLFVFTSATHPSAHLLQKIQRKIRKRRKLFWTCNTITCNWMDYPGKRGKKEWWGISIS
jgi:hypothetical protein